MVRLVRSTLFAVIFYGGCVPVVMLALVLTLFGNAGTIAGARLWARWHYWCARVLLGIRVKVIGSLPQHGAIVAMKHESMFETIETLRLFDRPAVVMKAELESIPLWGTVSRKHGSIFVARDAGASALRKMLAAGKAALAQDRPIVIFPEGTRTPHGTRAPLRPGIAGLYKALGVPIVPVALDSGRLSPKGSFLKRSGVITYLVGDPIPPGLPREEVEQRVFNAINALND